MKNAQTILTNYVTPDGNVFKFEDGEQIIVDSFSFVSAMNKVTYVGFLTNRRFIFKQSEHFSANGMGIQEGLTANCSFLWLNDLKGIKISKGKVVFDGKVIDFSNDQDTENWQFGTYGKGTFGGLSYRSHDEVYVRLTEALVELSQQYDFHIWAPRRPEITTSTKEQKKRLNHIRSRQLKIALGVVGAIIGGLAIVALTTGSDDPQPVVATQIEETYQQPQVDDGYVEPTADRPIPHALSEAYVGSGIYGVDYDGELCIVQDEYVYLINRGPQPWTTANYDCFVPTP